MRDSDRAEMDRAGVSTITNNAKAESCQISSADITKLQALLNKMGSGSGVSNSQNMWKVSYTYNANGNIASKSTAWGTITYTYNSENRLIKKGNINYTYDREGNLTEENDGTTKVKYQYNGNNRMISMESIAVKNNKTIEKADYDYDAYGRRTITAVDGETPLRTVYDGMGFDTVLQGTSNWNRGQTSGYSTMAVKNVRLHGAGGEAVGIRTLNSSSSGSMGYFAKDALGSVRKWSGSNGSIGNEYEFDVFGVMYNGSMTTGIYFGYTGKEYDIYSEMYNYGYRDYMPDIQRFTTVDPIRDGYNWYAYVNNDPVNYVDLWGLDPLTQREIELFEAAGGKPINYSSINVIEEKPTVDDLKKSAGFDVTQYAQSLGVPILEVDKMLQSSIDKSDAMSLPDGTIYITN
ncbi:MAG: hypothetical protein FWF22_07095, partial [Treponema sp.]|nr:hypothetical protein [Treponema sp.]